MYSYRKLNVMLNGEWMSESLMFNAKLVSVQLYHDKNKVQVTFDEIMFTFRGLTQ